MSNNLSDLNDHFFRQMNRLTDPGLNAEQLAVEVERTKAVKDLGREIISNARLALDAQIKISEIPEKRALPEMLN